MTALLLLAVGCSSPPAQPALPEGGDAGQTSPRPTATRSGPALPPSTLEFTPRGQPSAGDRRVLASYRKFLDAVALAYSTGDVEPLEAITIGRMRTYYTDRARTMHARSQTQRGPMLSSPLVLRIDGGAAVVVDCLDLRGFRTYDQAGKPLYPPDKGPTGIEATFSAVRNVWRLSDYTEQPAGCRR